MSIVPPLSQTGNLWLADTLWKLGAIEFGDFTLGKTAVHSPVHVNLRLLISKPAALQRAARVIRDEVDPRQRMLNPQVAPFQLVAGVPFGGLHLATASGFRQWTGIAPRKTVRMLSTAISAMRPRVATLALPMCGVRTTLSSVRRGSSGGIGSTAATSRAAAVMRRCFSAS